MQVAICGLDGTFDGANFYFHVVGSKAFRAGLISERINAKITEKNIQDQRVLEQVRFQILDLYRRSGFENTQVNFEFPQPGLIRCTIEEGMQILVQNIQVIGAQHFSAELLKKKIV